MTLKGKVVKKVDEYSIVVNLGETDGVKEEMEFVIYVEGDEIEDPDTDEKLGVMEYPKARVKPAHIMEKMSVMESNETELKSYSALDIFNTNPRQKEEKKELPVDDVPDQSKRDEPVQVGDLVKQYDPDGNPSLADYTGNSE